MNCSETLKSIGRSRISMFIALAGTTLLLAASSANAVCGSPERLGAATALKLPPLAQAAVGQQSESAGASIVGLWHVTYTSEGTLFYEAYDQWHSDHTEFENANLSPIESNICMGVWKKVGPRTVQLNHVGWSFDGAGNSDGTFTIGETNTVANDGKSYRGTFDYKFFNPDGSLGLEISGTLTATRITAD